VRVKKRMKRGVKKGVKRVKSAPPEAYLSAAGVLVGGAAVLLLATTKSGQELLARTVQLVLHPEAEEEPAQESDAQEQEPAEGEDEEADTSGTDDSEVTDLRPQDQQRRRPRKAAAPRKVSNA
jgi:hypothetical protein